MLDCVISHHGNAIWRIFMMRHIIMLYTNIFHEPCFHHVDPDDDNNSLFGWILYISVYSWQWLPVARWLLFYVPFKALFQRDASLENSLYSNDSLISCFLSFVVSTTEMCVQILIRRWASLYCLFPLTVPLDWMLANQAIYFPLPSFSFPVKINSKIFWFAVTKACWFLSYFEKWLLMVAAELGIQ